MFITSRDPMHKSSITKTDNTKVLSKQKSTVKKTYAHEYTSLFHVRVYIRERERERERCLKFPQTFLYYFYDTMEQFVISYFIEMYSIAPQILIFNTHAMEP